MEAPQTARLEALAQFAAGAGHELNNPAAAIWGRVQLLLREEADPQRRAALASIGTQALRIRDMIGDLMVFARPPVPERRSWDLSDVIADVLPRFAAELHHGRVQLLGERPGGVLIWADRTQLCVVISELLRNALRFSPEGGRVGVSCGSEPGGAFAVLTVRDEGPGLSEEAREHLFDPFYSERQAGRGLGFGLPKCWRIVTLHGGTIEAGNIRGDADVTGAAAEDAWGMEFRVRWPASADVPAE